MNLILLVAAGVVLGLTVFAIVQKFVRLALLGAFVLIVGTLAWNAVKQAAPAASETIEDAATRLGKATGEAAKDVANKAAPIAGQAARKVADAARPVAEQAAKSAAKAGAELADKVADKVVDKVTSELLGASGDDDDSADR